VRKKVVPKRLYIHFGSDINAIVSATNRLRDTQPRTVLYEIDTLEQLRWALDFADSDPAENAIIEVAAYTAEMDKVVRAYHGQRELNFYAFFGMPKKQYIPEGDVWVTYTRPQ